MIKCDEEALICDLAETYHILNYRSLPLNLVATFSVGLRDDSRIKEKLRNDKVPFKLLLSAMAVDRLSMLVYSKTKDAEKGVNQPKLIVDALLGDVEKNTQQMSFNSIEEFEMERRKILGRGEQFDG